MKNWTTHNIPNLTNKIAIITGGNIGLGFEIALQLARKNAEIIIACRTISKGNLAIKKIESILKKSIKARVIQLDLTSMESIVQFTETFYNNYSKLDLLINNAGLVNLKKYETTNRGYEKQMATNHLGHFALTGLLISAIIKSENARVVTMSSGSYKFGDLNFEDFNWKNRPYNPYKSYGDSKLANMLFMIELQRYFDRNNINAISVAAHPGLSATERQQTIGMGGILSKIVAQPVAMGALPALLVATDKNVEAGDYYGPKWVIRGYPKLETIKPIVFEADLAKKLWRVSEKMTDVEYITLN